MKKYIALLFALLVAQFVFQSVFQSVHAQIYDNEWVNHNKTYYKFIVDEDGLYRITNSVLQQAGFPLNNPGAIRLFNKGKQIPIFVSTTSTIGNGDYIEFYGEKNEGEYDTQLFTDPDFQVTTKHSLFTPKSAYFLVIDNSIPAMRYSTISNDISVVPEPDEFFEKTVTRVLDQEFFDGKPDSRIWAGVNSFLSNFGQAEGFVSTVILPGELEEFSVLTPSVYNQGMAHVELKLVGRSNDLYVLSGDHHVTVELEGVVYMDTIYEGFNNITVDFDIPVSALSNVSQVGVKSVADIFNHVSYEELIENGTNIYPNYPDLSPDRNAVAYIEITYPHEFSFDGESSYEFNIVNNDVRYMEIENFNGGDAPILYDLTSLKRLVPFKDGNVYKVRINQIASAPEKRDMVICNTTGGLNIVNNLEAKQFVDFSNPANSGDYIVISNPSLYEIFNGENQVQRYLNYRSSETGGAYQPLLVDVQEIYDQFGFGILQHPQAFHNFSNFIVDQYDDGNWSIQPQYLFLLGKSIRYESCRNSENNFAGNLVPTFGSPGSDNLMSSRSIYTSKNQIATGRLSAKTPAEISEYLDKVVEYESWINQTLPCTTEDRKWLKDVLHIAAGDNGDQEEDFLSRLYEYEDIVEKPNFGGEVIATLSNANVNVITSPIDEYMNSGLSLITFFGHSNAQIWKYDIGDPEDYNNEGLYPFIFSASCFVGDIHKPYTSQSMSEQYALAPNRGAIGFLASVKFGFPDLLHNFSTSFYSNFSKNYYGQPISLSIQKTIDETITDEIGTQLTAQEFTLSCDPAITMYHFDNPEYILEPNSITFDPPNISAALDSVLVNIQVTNMGQAVEDSMTIQITQTFPDGSIGNVVEVVVPSPTYETTYQINMPIKNLVNQNPIGENIFTVSINGESAIDEDCFDNNNIVKSELILPTTALPIEPCQFSIVGDQDVVLKATSALPVLPATQYIFQMDTTALFNSPFLLQGLVTSEGGVIEWAPNFNAYQQERVYYWRISVNPQAQEEFAWEHSSFTYINESDDGWNQSHYFQFLEDEFDLCYINENTRQFEYDDRPNSLYCSNNYVTSGSGTQANNLLYKLNNINQVQSSCLLVGGAEDCRGGIMIAAFSSATLEQLISYRVLDGGSVCEDFGEYGNIHCTEGARPAFQFHTGTATDLTELNTFLNDIPTGYYVLAYSVNEHRLTGNSVFSDAALQPIHNFFEGSLGITAAQGMPGNFSNLNENSTFIVFGKKGDPNFDNKHLVSTTNQDLLLELDIEIESKKQNGNVISTKIGPAKKWDKLFWDNEQEATDFISLDVYGVDNSGNKNFLFSTGNQQAWELENQSADLYPFLILEAITSDSIQQTMPQLNYWRVLFDRYPEASLNQSVNYNFESDTLQAGESGTFEIAVTNVTDIDMDSLLVAYILVDSDQSRDTSYVTYPPLLANSTNDIFYEFSTSGMSGDVFFRAVVNPENNQQEKFDFNNQIIIPFHVLSDTQNPLLDVTFDGQHILDGDIVAANPEILIKVNDENIYLGLDGNSAEIILIYPDGTEENIDLNASNVTIVEPTAEAVAAGNNCVEILFTPTFVTDGTYQIRINGKDRNGNYSGENDYVASFQVITEAMISNVVNYPNPFTTSTRFIFTLTGMEVPENLKIQVFSISGKVVREITAAELGNVHIGRNISEYAWDGKDEFGNELGNGVYFYRVTASINNEELELFTVEDGISGQGNATSTKKMDELFGKYNIGKMYKMR